MGEISITWTIENFRSIYDDWANVFTLEWPKTKSNWDVGIVILRKSNGKFINITIDKNDDTAPFSLIGNIFAVNEKRFSAIKQYERFRFSRDKKEMGVFFAPFEITDFEKLYLSNNGSLTLYINLWEPNSNGLVAAEYFLRSTYIQQTCSFQWILQGDKDWKKNGEYNESSTVIPMEFTDFFSTQRFRMNIKLSIDDRDTFVAISVKDYETEHSHIQCIYNLKIQRKEGISPACLKTGWNQCFDQFDVLRKIFEEKWDYLSSEWVINIKIVVVTPHVDMIKKISREPNIESLGRKPVMSKRKEISNQNLQECMHSLYKEGKLCDVVLHADSESFPCHKAVLSARSSVFQQMIEKETSVININDIPSRILGIFLTYLHSDILEDTSFDSVMKLYAVADKYDVQNLQENCANIIVSYLSTENICEVLNLANSHKDEVLNEKILSYFSEHLKEIVNSSSWIKLLEMKPLLAAETLQKAVSKIL